MKDKQHLIVIDPTAFSGGSKVATESILALLNNQQFNITVLTADKDSWRGKHIKRVHLYEPRWLAQKEQGIGYFARHALIAINILIIRCRLGRFDIALGASGPGVDLALYMLSSLMKFNIIQLIHGPVAKSRTIGRCLKSAHQVHYLQSCESSLKTALRTIAPQQSSLPAHFHLFKNGLSKQKWPSACQDQQPVIFWAASLLKWKRLDHLLTALKAIPEIERPVSHICYIKPQGIQLPVSDAPIRMQHVHWYKNPDNIDQLRASANIFVSTSTNEPFGLSILEAMAAGQCVVIPADGAYWDQILTHRINCIKYNPTPPNALKEALQSLSQDMPLISLLGQRAANVAQDYQAEKQYKQVLTSIEQSTQYQPTKHTLTGRSV